MDWSDVSTLKMTKKSDVMELSSIFFWFSLVSSYPLLTTVIDSTCWCGGSVVLAG